LYKEWHKVNIPSTSRDSSASIATRMQAVQLMIQDSRQEQRLFPLLPSLLFPSLPTNCVRGGEYFLPLRLPGYDTEVKNVCSYTSSPQSAFIACCLTKHRDIFKIVLCKETDGNGCRFTPLWHAQNFVFLIFQLYRMDWLQNNGLKRMWKETIMAQETWICVCLCTKRNDFWITGHILGIFNLFLTSNLIWGVH
jgi:hypothetical protein